MFTGVSFYVQLEIKLLKSGKEFIRQDRDLCSRYLVFVQRIYLFGLIPVITGSIRDTTCP